MMSNEGWVGTILVGCVFSYGAAKALHRPLIKLLGGLWVVGALLSGLLATADLIVGKLVLPRNETSLLTALWTISWLFFGEMCCVMIIEKNETGIDWS